MALYAFVALKYTVPLERILQTVDRHRAYLRELLAQGKMVCSGPFVPRSGGALLLRVSDEKEIPEILARDARPGDVVILMSSGAFGGLPATLMEPL